MANEVPDEREQKKGESDKHGYKQKEVEKIPKSNNPFRDKSKIRIKEDGKEKKIQLPEGVKDDDVDKVFKTDPKTYKVKVKSSPEKKDLDKLKDTLGGGIVFGILAVCLVIPVPVQAQENCPEGYRCVPDDAAEEIREVLNHQQCMKEALEEGNEDFEYTTEPYEIVVTKDGQVFSKDEITSHLRWCDYNLEFQSDPNLNVHIKDETEYGDWKFEFRPRVRLGMTFHPLDIPAKFRELISPALLFEPFHIGLLHPEAHVGLKSFGMNVGVDVTRNMDIFGGAGVKWNDPSAIRPIIGLSLSFS
jgi:hypothetical protein